MSETGSYCTVFELSELPPGEKRIYIHNDQRAIALFHLESGIYALDNACMHRGASIGEGDVYKTTVTCPWHWWQYDIPTGRCVDNPEIHMNTYPVRVLDGAVQVRL